MIIHNVQQGSPEWKSLRCGRITASCFSDVLCKGAGRDNYMMKIIAERLTGISQDGFVNAAMEWGTQQEPYARLAYEAHKDVAVQQIGFAEYDSYVGVSPDGLVGDDGLLEIKSPNSSTHIEYLLRGKIPSKYVAQVQGQLWVMGRQWSDFCSFDPRVKERPYCCYRVERDDKYIDNLKSEIGKFISEMNDRIDDIMRGEK